MNKFSLTSTFQPAGDQPYAIKELVAGIQQKKRAQTLLGVTGSGKTFTLACVIAQVQKPTLVISHNKTLAAQLYSEFKEFFPHNGVEYFVSYYDYYQPESYIPQTDTYIEKDASINDRLDRLRLSATSSLVSRNDVIVVSSVSCIYNLGSPQDYRELILFLRKGSSVEQEIVIQEFIRLQYERNDFDFHRGVFRVRGDTIDIFPAYKEKALRIKFWGDTIEELIEFDPLTGKKISFFDQVGVYPAKHFIMAEDKIENALSLIREELDERITYFKQQGKILEAERIRMRTLYDMEMMKEAGYCHGIENYSRPLSGRPPGARPYCLIDYFPQGFLTIIDESHVTIPQLRGMFQGDRSRKETLVNYGFRLPSCMDNRPLRFEEFMKLIGQVIFVSATPGIFERKMSQGVVVEQIIRPTGLPDPEIEVRPNLNQIDDIIKEVTVRAAKNERSIITTLTKRMSEELSSFLKEQGVSVCYLHSEIDTIERAKILREVRIKKFDCIVGINLLREGIDLPEVSLVVILDADREGFLRSATSLIQISGRCARNVHAKVIMYAQDVTDSMKKAIEESRRRRKIQLAYNKKHHITPYSVARAIKEGIEVYAREEKNVYARLDLEENEMEIMETITYLERDMQIAAKNLQFEKAAQLRDKLYEMQNVLKQEREKNGNVQ